MYVNRIKFEIEFFKYYFMIYIEKKKIDLLKRLRGVCDGEKMIVVND